MNKQPLALIVDDEPDILQLLGITLSRMKVDTHQASNLTQAYRLLGEHQFDLCLTDMRLPDGDGLELVNFIQQNHPDLPVAVITAHGNMNTAIEAMKNGAFDFLSKPVDLQTLRNLVSVALKLSQPATQEKTSGKGAKKQLIGDTAVMKELKQTILKLARSQAPVLIHGESGTGKELVAKLIHHKGPRADKPFVPVNCGAIPTELMESEFFGHKKGSFTGAVSDKKGLFQSAEGGTLFLDEIAELPLSMQVKLLRAIQEKSVRPVGCESEVSVDVRILSATHRNLLEMVETEKFRQDLFYRINVIELEVPPLRERSNDIPKLADYLLEQLAVNQGYEKTQLSKNALLALKSYDFPGNIRELENILERAITLSSNNQIDLDDLKIPCNLAKLSQANDQSVPTGGTKPVDTLYSRHKSQSLDEFLENIELDEINKALDQCKGNRTQAAKLLGISFRAMRYKLKKLNIE